MDAPPSLEPPRPQWRWWAQLAGLVLPPAAGLTLAALHWRSLRRSAGGLPDAADGPVPPIEADADAAAPKDHERAWGEWTPPVFAYPPVTPLVGPLDAIAPRIYRPFKPGPYNVTLAIRAMPWDEWIELDRDYMHYHTIRAQRLRTRGARVVNTLPAVPGLVGGGHEPAKELLQELAAFLGARYPDAFRVHRAPRAAPDRPNDTESDPITAVTVLATGETHAFDAPGADPMAIAALLVQDDLAVLVEGTDGLYYLQAGAILVAGSWRLEEKLGRSLDAIHIGGGVPQYAEKLQFSLTKFFRRLKVDAPVARNNYGFQVVADAADADALDADELAWCATTNGPEDAPAGDVHAPPRDVAAAAVVFRTERQTLRRLPRTGAVVFTIRTYLARADALAREAGVAARLARAVRGWGADVWRYKRGDVYGAVLVDYLERCAGK